MWWVDLDDADWDIYAPVLSPDESARATQFRVACLQQRYRRGRSALRTVLATYCGCAPDALEFQYGHAGKPELKNLPLHFNISHSLGRAIIGIATAPMGVDIEYIDNNAGIMEDTIDLVCHETELIFLKKLPQAQRLPMFYSLWTQKEAYCKLLGTGLGEDLKSLRLEPSGENFSLRVLDEGREGVAHFVATRFQLPGYVFSACSGDGPGIDNLATARQLKPVPPARDFAQKRTYNAGEN